MAHLHMDFIAPSIGMQTQVNIIIPEAKPSKDMPIVYLLHGLSDNASNWVRRTSIERYADEHGCIVVMPEVQRSFYTNMEYGIKYFDYVTKDLPAMLHKVFGCNISRENSFIAGLSMGGYGALKCALALPGNYAGVAAFSSVCDVQQSIDNAVLGSGWPKTEIQGIFGMDCKAADKDNLFKLVEAASKAQKRPRMMLTCGTEDVLYDQNIRFRDKAVELGFAPEYQEWEDGHSWGFWDVSIQLALDFFFDTAE